MSADTITPTRFPPMPCKGCRHLVYGRRDPRGDAYSEIGCGWWKAQTFPLLRPWWFGQPVVTTLQGRIDVPFTDGPMPECPQREESR